MSGSGVHRVGFIPKLSILDASRSIRRSLITGGDSPSSARKVPTPTQLPLLSPLSGRRSTIPTKVPFSSRSKTAGDDHGFHWISALSRCACFVLVALVVAFVLGIQHLSHEWTKISSRCSSITSSSTSPRGEGQSVPSAVDLHSQDDSFEGNDETGDENEEDEKCWSRSRQWKYRPSERHFPPSPSLTRALKIYESLHARCTAGKKWEALTEMTESENNGSCKYLMYVEGWEGLGNRFMSLVTAFTYALMTDRVLLLDTRRNMHDLICEPFQGSSWNLPATFPFEKVDELPTLDDFGDRELERVTAVRLDLRHEQSEQSKRFFCADMQERLGQVALIGWKSNQYYVPRLYTMPQFWEKLNRLFDDPSVVFTQLSRILLLPQNALWIKIERVYKSYLATAKKLVGIQVRSPQFSSFEQLIFDRAVHCLTGDDHIIPRISEEPLPLGKGSHPEDGTAIFISSLQREYYERFKEEYAERGAEDGTLVTVHTMAADGQEKASYDHSVKAFIDMFLLSFSDLLATSGWSTFGYAAQGIGGIFPRIVNTDPKQPEACDHGQSIEPCTHFPFLSSCPAPSLNDGSQHGEWVKKHLRPCQDHHLGIQLVSSSD